MGETEKRRLAAKSNPRWRKEKGKKHDTRRRIVSRNSSPCPRSISPPLESLEQPFHHFLWKISRERVNGKDCRAKNFSRRIDT